MGGGACTQTLRVTSISCMLYLLNGEMFWFSWLVASQPQQSDSNSHVSLYFGTEREALFWRRIFSEPRGSVYKHLLVLRVTRRTCAALRLKASRHNSPSIHVVRVTALRRGLSPPFDGRALRSPSLCAIWQIRDFYRLTHDWESANGPLKQACSLWDWLSISLINMITVLWNDWNRKKTTDTSL